MNTESTKHHVSFDIRRHTLKDAPGGKRVGPLGMRLARLIGEHELQGRGFTHFYVSPRWRTTQTLVGFDEGARDFHALVKTPEPAPFYSQHPDLGGRYRPWHEAEGRGEDMVAFALMHDLPLVIDVSAIMEGRFRDWAATFPNESKILVIGHSPELEFLIMGLNRYTQPTQLKPGQGYQFDLINGAVSRLMCSEDPNYLGAYDASLLAANRRKSEAFDDYHLGRTPSNTKGQQKP